MKILVLCQLMSPLLFTRRNRSPLIIEFRQLAWQSDGAWVVETCWNLVVQALARTLVIEHVAKVIKSTLLGAKGGRRRFCRVLLQCAMHPLMAAVLLRSTCLNALMHDPELHPTE
ncbi:hypothetical protein EDE15_4056 [Edaphobacter aggregans]|uniref:Uncharacterized protein n=1 Tax=Edaphobacter aggregans TaxID=570835 RepID=A0A3R9NZJ7_9BACT|nr:hypothetical protein EDE15_4056 [Edaphobacter aggregans]